MKKMGKLEKAKTFNHKFFYELHNISLQTLKSSKSFKLELKTLTVFPFQPSRASLNKHFRDSSIKQHEYRNNLQSLHFV